MLKGEKTSMAHSIRNWMRNKKFLVFQDLFQDDYRVNICRTKMIDHFFCGSFWRGIQKWNEILWFIKGFLINLIKAVFSLIDGVRILKIGMKPVCHIGLLCWKFQDSVMSGSGLEYEKDEHFNTEFDKNCILSLTDEARSVKIFMKLVCHIILLFWEFQCSAISGSGLEFGKKMKI